MSGLDAWPPGSWRTSSDALAEQAVLADRARIARKLHDVVAQHISVITIRAEAVALQAEGNPGRWAEELAEIRALSLRTLAEMRQVLGLLRDHNGAGHITPQPGLHLLDELVANVTSAGFDVTVSVSGVRAAGAFRAHCQNTRGADPDQAHPP